MEALIYIQEDRYEKLIKNESNYKKTPKERLTKNYVGIRCENLEKIWEEFKGDHIKIVALLPKAERSSLAYFKSDVYSEFEEVYTRLKTKMKDDMSRLTPTYPNPDQQMSNCEVKLPRIQLPNFKGNYEEWQTFYDMFLSLIHNNGALSAVQKLHYLKSSLSGEPLNLISTLATTEANYSEAWSQLNRRYNNKKHNCNEILKRLFSQKTITGESASAIKWILDTTSSCLKSLNNLKIDTSGWDIIIVYLVETKLDQESRKQWQTYINKPDNDDLPTWADLINFLETRYRCIEMLDDKKTKPMFTKPNMPLSQPKPKSYHSTKEQQDTKNKVQTCTMCSGNHLLFQCKQFAEQSIDNRTNFVKSKLLCFNCLSGNHTVRNCHQPTSCRRCGRRHHSLLHIERANMQSKDDLVQSTTSNENNSESETKVVAHFSKSEPSSPEVLLATAKVNVKSRNGYNYIIRALLDQGSQASFITESTVQLLGLKRVPVSGRVSGLGDANTRIKHMVSLSIKSRTNPVFSLQVNAYVLGSLTTMLPTCMVNLSGWLNTVKISLADQEYGSPGKINILLGAEAYSEVLLEGIMRDPQSGVVAQQTTLGWILSGQVRNNSTSAKRVITMHAQIREDQLLKQFWEIEREPDCLKKKLTKEEIKCEELYETTTVRDEDGKYVVRLSFRNENPQCQYSESKEIALRRFLATEKRLLRNPQLYENYKRVIEEYEELNHMSKITNIEEINYNKAVYLPHHAVIRNDKDTTKVRVVFDASCKGSNSISLNDDLMVGPKLQQDLRHILMRWRRHPICLNADIVKMYRQVRVNKQDSDFQRILRRSNPNESVQHYRLLTLTFGTAAAPYLAVKSMQQLAKDEQLNYPVAAKITQQDYYVDDLMTGCETEEEAIEIYTQINKLMKAGGFELQKWSSNSVKLLKYMEKQNQRMENHVHLKINDLVKVLGICWNKTIDAFEYTIQFPDNDLLISKRKVLSEIARLYDPLGWIAPVVVIGKIFMQKLWKSGLDWDEELTPNLLHEWLRYKNDLSQVKVISIPRWLHTKKDSQVELHVFADASSVAYAAVVYMRVVDQTGEVHVSLVTAKTKVAPIEKEISIPRMELCGAALATKLIFEVSQVMDISKENLYAWTDSTIVLAWLRGLPNRWTTFVSNRVSEILNILDYTQWNHVISADNPADCASRGMLPSEISEHSIWWYGPSWLSQTTIITKLHDFSTHEEQRVIKTLACITTENEEFIWKRFSDLNRMMRVLAYCRRVMNLRKPKHSRKCYTKVLTVDEINEILKICVMKTQEMYFEDEIKEIKVRGWISTRSQLHTLCPILDEDNILRVGGRLRQANIKYETKHPIIIPKGSHLTKLLVLDAHKRTLHGGPQLMMNYLRSGFWIIRMRNEVKKIYRNCVTCLRYSKRNTTQLMGQLPQVRVQPSKPFKASGVDLAGPINIRVSPGRGSKSYKGYICLFVCMSTRAVHLEAVSDLTSKAFIAAFRRFTSRRGHCRDLYSDNGTNFVGADRLLKEMFNKATSELPSEIAEMLSKDGTRWHFNPPQAPNFGGLWEAGVRSVKSHLKRVIGESTLTFEEMSTLLAQIEACLNSRPLTGISDDPNDTLPLTPGHFLVGEPLINIVDDNFKAVDASGHQRWQLTQKMLNDFWKKWSQEYLVTLNNRSKWTLKRSEPDVGDVVIVRDSNAPPAKWLLGRVIQKHSGKTDNITRVVTVKCGNHLFKRPCSKLCILPKSSLD